MRTRVCLPNQIWCKSVTFDVWCWSFVDWCTFVLIDSLMLFALIQCQYGVNVRYFVVQSNCYTALYWISLNCIGITADQFYWGKKVIENYSLFYITRNTFCGTWYLPHNQVHNDGAVPIIKARCNAHARNSHISTSALKSDITIAFLNSSFLLGFRIRRFSHK